VRACRGYGDRSAVSCPLPRRRSQAEGMRRDRQRVGEAAQHGNVSQRGDPAFIPGDLRRRVASPLPELGEGKPARCTGRAHDNTGLGDRRLPGFYRRHRRLRVHDPPLSVNPASRSSHRLLHGMQTPCMPWQGFFRSGLRGAGSDTAARIMPLSLIMCGGAAALAFAGGVHRVTSRPGTRGGIASGAAPPLAVTIPAGMQTRRNNSGSESLARIAEENPGGGQHAAPPLPRLASTRAGMSAQRRFRDLSRSEEQGTTSCTTTCSSFSAARGPRSTLKAGRGLGCRYHGQDGPHYPG